MTTYRLIAIVLIVFFSSTFAQNSWIRVNQLGYTPESIKVAVLASKDDSAIPYFELVDILTNKTVFRSKDIQHYGSYACFTNLLRLSFSEFTQNGSFFIKAGDITSPTFVINDDIYQGAADFLLQYMRQQHCGYNPFLRDSCHTFDGFIVDHPELESVHINVTGGWHDASDYLQYVTTSANAVYQMLFAYKENPTSFADKYTKNGDPGVNGIPDILDEAKWGLDWLDKMNPQYGFMFNQIADDRDHTTFTLPTLDSVHYGKALERPVYFVTGKPQGLGQYKNRSTGVASTAAKYASAFALGSVLLQSYYPQFCEKISAKAFDAYRFAKTDLGVCQTASNRAPYFYEEDNYVDDMELAAVQLYLNSRDPTFLSEAIEWGELEPITPWMVTDTARHYQWYPFVNVGHYLVAQTADPVNKTKFTKFLRKGLEKIVQRGRKNGFFIGIPFIWCSNNLIVATLTQLRLYHQLTRDSRFLEMEAALRDWLFGCNPWGTSMIVGFPQYGDTPVDPHSAFSAVYNLKINGGLVDGPIYTSTFNKLIGLRLVEEDEYAEFQSDLCVYHDDYGDYSTNEPTMDGTASFTFYLSALAKQFGEKGSSTYHMRHGGIIRGDTSLKNIHLVFTGGDYNDGGEWVQQTLKKQNVKAHFFFTGDFYREDKNKKIIEKLIRDGHYLGAHSDKHLLYASWENRDSLLIDKDMFINDIKNNYTIMASYGITKEQANLFLPPYEWYNKTISKWTKELGLTLINFTPGTSSNADYTTPDMGQAYKDSETIYKTILQYEEQSDNGLNGFFLLMHVGTHPRRLDKFYMKLGELIAELKRRGYDFTLFNL